MSVGQRRAVGVGVVALAMLVVVGSVGAVVFWGRSASSVAPPQDTNPTGRGSTARGGNFGFLTPTANVATEMPVSTSTPAPAPPRGTIVYERDGTIYLLVLGGQERVLVPSGQQPKLSPDGTRVVYIGRTGGANGQLLLVTTQTRQISVLSDKAKDPALPSWSPDGRTVAFRALAGVTPEVFTIAMDGSHLSQVTQSADLTTGATQPVWSKDGAALLYKNGADGGFYRIPVGGGAPERIHATNGQQYDLAVSPDGKMLAFTQKRADDNEFGVYVMDASGANERKIAPLPSVTAPQQLGALAWAPNGASVLVASGGAFQQEVFDLKTGKASAPVAYGAWPSWIAAEIAAPK